MRPVKMRTRMGLLQRAAMRRQKWRRAVLRGKRLSSSTIFPMMSLQFGIC